MTGTSTSSARASPGSAWAGVLDEILVCVAPVLHGDGVRLFDQPGGTNVRLGRLSLTEAPGATDLWLRVVR